MQKPHLEFHTQNLNEGWETPPGYPAGIKQKIIAGTLDEANKVSRWEKGIVGSSGFGEDDGGPG
jgi:hypothetical protein